MNGAACQFFLQYVLWIKEMNKVECLIIPSLYFAVSGLMSGPLLKEVFATLSQSQQTPDDLEVDDTDDEEQDEVQLGWGIDWSTVA